MKDIVKKIGEKLVASGWYDKLRIYLNSCDFEDILKELKRKVNEENQRFVPALQHAFKFLELVPLQDIKVVILVDHINNKIEADGGGLPLQKPAGTIEQPLSYIHSSVGKKIDCIEWCKQGVLTIPIALTARVEGKAHKELWNGFIMRLIEVINKHHDDIPWVLMGQETFQYENDIKSGVWTKMRIGKEMDKGWTMWVNRILEANHQKPINW